METTSNNSMINVKITIAEKGLFYCLLCGYLCIYIIRCGHLSIQGPQGRYCIGLDKGEKLPIVYSPNGRFECINMTLPIRYLVYQYYQTQLGGGGYSARAYMCPVAPPFVQVAMVVDLYLRYQLVVSC